MFVFVCVSVALVCLEDYFSSFQLVWVAYCSSDASVSIQFKSKWAILLIGSGLSTSEDITASVTPLAADTIVPRSIVWISFVDMQCRGRSRAT